jgi:membrane associated rhomboid family serine protease
MAKRRKTDRRGRRRAWIPIAAALGLLAMLGSGGGRVDVLAHLFGFSFGAVLGVFVAYLAPDPPRLRAQWGWGAAALGVVIWCWTLAFSR